MHEGGCRGGCSRRIPPGSRTARCSEDERHRGLRPGGADAHAGYVPAALSEALVEIDLLDRNVDQAEEGYALVLRLTSHPPEGLADRSWEKVRHIWRVSDVPLDG